LNQVSLINLVAGDFILVIMSTRRCVVEPSADCFAKVVTKTVDVFECNSSLIKHHIYFNKFFTSYWLLSALCDRGVCATGTI